MVWRMIPRVRLPDRSVRDGARSAFGLGRDARRLRVVVDLDSVGEGIDRTLLLGFQWHPDVDLRPIRLSQVVLDREGGATIEQRVSDGERVTFVRAVANHVDVAEKILGRRLDGSDWAKRMALVCLAELDGADAFVTQSPDLLDLSARSTVTRSNTMSVEAGLALLGLFLRHRGDFTISQGEAWEKHLRRGSYYDLHAALLLPHIGRWMARCPDSVAGEVRRPRVLVDAVLTRISRALRARDALVAYLLMDAGFDPPDDALLHLDTLLVALRGAFDAAAGVTHTAEQPDAKIKHPGWWNDGWCKRLKEGAPKLRPFLEPGGLLRDTCDIVNFLRAFVHSEPLEPVFAVDGLEVTSGSLLVPPHDDQSKFLAALDAQGGREAWGIHPLGGGAWELGLHPFVERALSWSSAALDLLCTHVQVERFGVGSQADEESVLKDMVGRAGDAIIPVLALGAVGPIPYVR